MEELTDNAEEHEDEASKVSEQKLGKLQYKVKWWKKILSITIIDIEGDVLWNDGENLIRWILFSGFYTWELFQKLSLELNQAEERF